MDKDDQGAGQVKRQTAAQNDGQKRIIQNHSSQKKIALPLWIKLKHALPEQEFDVLLTLDDEALNAERIQSLIQQGLKVPEFYLKNPCPKVPGTVSKANIERHLVDLDSVLSIEGVLKKSSNNN